jgi:hypothetical protein
MKAVFASLVAMSVFAFQNPTGQLEFDAVSVKVVDRSSLGRGGGPRATGGPGTSDPGRFTDPADTRSTAISRPAIQTVVLRRSG